jgi:hypothetical protein
MEYSFFVMENTAVINGWCRVGGIARKTATSCQGQRKFSLNRIGNQGLMAIPKTENRFLFLQKIDE